MAERKTNSQVLGIQPQGVRKMKVALIGAALIATATLASPAAAQHVVTNPGYCAQFYPNANCQNYGPGNPYTRGYQARSWDDSYGRMHRHSMDRHSMHHKKMRHHKRMR
jgi:hypothetical protein